MKETDTRSLKTEVLPGESLAIHAKLDDILSDGDVDEILLVLCVLLELRPFSRRKPRKTKGQPKRPPSKTQTRTRRAPEATTD
jgi:hypothetical protein